MTKTKSSIKKRFKVTGSGLLKISQSGKRHGMRKRAKRVLLGNKGYTVSKKCEVRRVIRLMPGIGARKIRLKSNKTLMKEICKELQVTI